MFPSLPSNSYLWAVVTPQFLTGGYWSANATEATLANVANTTVWGLYNDQGTKLVQQNLSWVLSLIPIPSSLEILQEDAINGTRFTKIDKITCLQHDSSITGNQSNLIMVSSQLNNTNNTLLIAGLNDVRMIKHASPWMCASSNSFSCSALALTDFAGSRDNEREKNREQAIDNWNVAGYKIDYCLQAHRSTENLCNVEYSLVVMVGKSVLRIVRIETRTYFVPIFTNGILVVCIFNFVKLVCIGYTAIYYKKRDEPSLSVLGDAIASFLITPDSTTEKMSLLSKSEIKDDITCWKDRQPRPWQPHTVRWSSALSLKRRTVTLAV